MVDVISKKAISHILGFDTENDAHDNLLGAYIDLREAKADKVCLETINRVLGQLWALEKLTNRED